MKEKLNNTKTKVGGCLALIVLVLILANSPFKSEHGAFGSWLNHMGDEQNALAEKQTEEVASHAEGTLVGEHEIDGSNWAIPSIIAHLFGQN